MLLTALLSSVFGLTGSEKAQEEEKSVDELVIEKSEPDISSLHDEEVSLETETNVSSTSDKILLKDTPIEDIIGMSAERVIEIFGEPEYYGELEMVEYYDDMLCFYLSENNTVADFAADPNKLSLNGQHLPQDFDAIVSIFGESYEGRGRSQYTWAAAWQYGNCDIVFEFMDDGTNSGVMNVHVYSVAANENSEAEYGYSESLDTGIGEDYIGTEQILIGFSDFQEGYACFQFGDSITTTALIDKEGKIIWECDVNITQISNMKDGLAYFRCSGYEHDTYMIIDSDKVPVALGAVENAKNAAVYFAVNFSPMLTKKIKDYLGKDHGSKVKQGSFAECSITNFADKACIFDEANNRSIFLISDNVYSCRFIIEKFRPSKMKTYYLREFAGIAEMTASRCHSEDLFSELELSDHFAFGMTAWIGISTFIHRTHVIII